MKRNHLATLAIASLSIAACGGNPTGPTPSIPGSQPDHIIPLAIGNQWTYERAGETATHEIPEWFPVRLDTAVYRGTIDQSGTNRGTWAWYGPGGTGWNAFFAIQDGRVYMGTSTKSGDLSADIQIRSYIPDHPTLGDTLTDSYFFPGYRYTGDSILTVPAGTFHVQRYESPGPGTRQVLFLSPRIGLVQDASVDDAGHETNSPIQLKSVIVK